MCRDCETQHLKVIKLIQTTWFFIKHKNDPLCPNPRRKEQNWRLVTNTMTCRAPRGFFFSVSYCTFCHQAFQNHVRVTFHLPRRIHRNTHTSLPTCSMVEGPRTTRGPRVCLRWNASASFFRSERSLLGAKNRLLGRRNSSGCVRAGGCGCCPHGKATAEGWGREYRL